MAEEANKKKRINWWLPLSAAAVALVIFLPIFMFNNFDVSEIVYFFVFIPLGSLFFAVVFLVTYFFKKSSPSLSIYLMFPAYWIVSAVLFMNSAELRCRTRWLLHSNEFKTTLMAHSIPANGDLRHIEWDGWGWAGMDTTEYLVYDPTDSLWGAAKSRSPGKFPGIPCEVPRVRRLESHWYSVTFYTDMGWGKCN
jgi:hypothetical protein